MKKKSFLKKMISPVLVPVTKTYLSKERSTSFFGIHLTVPVGIFHPHLFFSTKTLAQWILQQDLADRNLLEIGCGSGAISILSVKQGAKVTCCDINPLAVKTTLENAEKNQAQLNCIVSDIFDQIEKDPFDLILNNPPYYPQHPSNMAEYAWYAGENFEYFKKLFSQSKPYLAKGSSLILVLSDECNTTVINEIAGKEGFENRVVYSRSNFLEKTFIIQYKIQV